MAEWWLGARLSQIIQRRGVTQDELAGRVGLSQNYISKLERGERDGLTVVTFYKLVDALGMKINIVDKVGEGKAEDDVREQDRELIFPLRRLLLPIMHVDSSLDGEELTPARLRKRVMESTAVFNHARYAKLAAEIPTLVTSIDAAIGLHEGEAKENLNRLLAHVYILTAQTLILLRSEDLACLAVGNAMKAAENAGDLVLRATAAQTYGWAFIRQGMYGAAETTAVNMANEIEPPSISKATPEHLGAWGRLFEIASGAVAHDNRPDTARELLAIAHSAAVRLDGGQIDYGKYWTALDSDRINIAKTSNALIEGDVELALHIGQTVRRTKNTHLDSWTRFLLDMADAQTATRDYAKAIETMKSIRGLAPEWIKNHRVAHDVVLRLLDAVSVRRARSSGLAELAQFMGVAP